MSKFISTAGVVVSLVAAMLIPPAARAQDEGDLRLVGGSSANEGRVEVFHDGQWGTVCDDLWDQPDADVVCRQLGLGPSVDAPGSAFFGQGSDPIWMDNVNCDGTESRLVDCPFAGFGNDDCSHVEDAGVVCSPKNEAAPAMGTTILMLSAVALIVSGTFVLRRRKQTT